LYIARSAARISASGVSASSGLCRLAERHHRLADRVAALAEKQPRMAFSWIRDREA
jgi:hypothetical protein